ncbi:MAG: thioredoxin domain-containing protein [Proteobacteria bacterium]|nr:thioredoxin domain-containing protein [Pseudomonadota bacterium]
MINPIISKRCDIKPLPFLVYSGTIAFLLLAGLADSIYLSVHHYLVYTDIGYESFCAISKAINCDTVSQSPYSIFLGVPVAVWGVSGYLFCLLLLPFAFHSDAGKKRMWHLIFPLSLIFSLISIIFAVISNLYIHSYCIMCIASYGINFLLLFYSWLIIRRFGEKEGIIKGFSQDIKFVFNKKRLFLSLFVPYAVLVISAFIYFPAYWNLSPPPLSANIPKGITEDGHPWIGGSEIGGSKNSELVITEFTDYLCFQCKKMHFFLRHLIEKNPGKIRLIHRHYPMDHRYNPIVKEPFHVGSGDMSLLSIYAANEGKFWEMNDVLFGVDISSEKIDIKELAEKTGLDADKLAASIFDNNIRRSLWFDIRDGLKAGITGTPAYMINGKLYLGEIPADILKKAINYSATD